MATRGAILDAYDLAHVHLAILGPGAVYFGLEVYRLLAAAVRRWCGIGQERDDAHDLQD